MAYNKTKHLDAAQKHLNQGKLPLAIEEYKNILKHEPRDQATLMTVGDLFVRQGETFQALEYFERLAQIFLNEGFVAKAIAIYKKIAKLAPEQTRPIERLAELYVQQGILSEARPLYLHLAEQHQRAGRNPQAAALLRKLLEAEPDSPRVHTRLAELCMAMGQPAEAAAAYRSAAEHLHRRGDHAEAIQYADRALQTDPSDLASSVLKARAMIGVGQRAEAVALLKSLPQSGAGNDASDLLLDLYLEDGALAQAAELAEKLYAFHSKRFTAVHRVVDAYLEAHDPEPALPLLDRIRESMTDAGQHEELSQSLQQAAELLPARMEPREWLVQLYQRTSDSFRLPDALAELARVLEKAGRYERAKQIYEQILERDPENESARRNYENALTRMGSGGAEEEPAEEAAQAEPVPQGEPALDSATQQFVTQSLTDVDLFSSYGLMQKAIDLLEVVLERAPRHVPSMERLLDLYLGAGNERRTAELASELQQILTERGDFAGADRFEQLHRRFERAAAISAAEQPAAKAPAPPEPPRTAAPLPEAPELSMGGPFSIPELAPLPEPVPAHAEEFNVTAQELDGELTVHEVDLSEEWAALAGQLKSMPSPEFPQNAAAGASPAAESAPPPRISEMVPVEVNSAAAEPLTLPQPELLPEVPITPADSMDEGADAPVFTLDFDNGENGASATGDEFLNALSAELEAALPTSVPEAPAPPLPVHQQAEPAMFQQAAPPVQQEAPKQEAPVPMAEAEAEAFAPKSAAPAPVNIPVPADSSAPGPLSDLFDDFRAELDELAKEEDPETHYNLGTAYREMGLIDEAISEFQKVAKATRGKPAFRYSMQCCTLLGLSFMEKGQPLIAAMWYERALELPGLEQETILALRYDLGVAQELAGETAAARKSFSQVYGMNIDYRDVAERLAALGKGS